MKPITLLFSVVTSFLLLTTILSKRSQAQCIIPVPNTATIVNGTMTINTFSSNAYYVGNGDSLFRSSNVYDTIYVASGGCFMDTNLNGWNGNYLIYAAANAYVKLDSSMGMVIHDNQAIIDVNYSMTDSVCSPLWFDLQAQGSSVADSFNMYTSKSCAGPTFVTITDNYFPGSSIVTDFGDGNVVTSPVQSGSNNHGYVHINHNYVIAGSYTESKHYIMEQMLWTP